MRIVRVIYTRVYEFEEKELEEFAEIENMPDEELKNQALIVANNYMSVDMETMNQEVENFANPEIEII